MSLKKALSYSGQVKADVTGPLNYHNGIWLIRFPKPGRMQAQGPFAREAKLLAVVKNVGKFQYSDGTTVNIHLASDRILGTMAKSAGNPGIFSLSEGSFSKNKKVSWNETADFRVWSEEMHTFEGASLEAIKIFDFRYPNGKDALFYPKYPRFEVGEIVLTGYSGRHEQVIHGLEYGYARVDSIRSEFEFIGTERVPLIHYFIRRSWKNILRDEWNRLLRISDHVQGEDYSIHKQATSVQTKIRFQLFDPFYRR